MLSSDDDEWKECDLHNGGGTPLSLSLSCPGEDSFDDVSVYFDTLMPVTAAGIPRSGWLDTPLSSFLSPLLGGHNKVGVPCRPNEKPSHRRHCRRLIDVSTQC